MIEAGFGVSIPRLYAYHRALREALAEGRSTITSTELARLLGESAAPAQIRKDLCALGALGRRGHGYAMKPLCTHLAFVLGLERDWRIVIAGFGYLGHAFAAFITAREPRFSVRAIFDASPSVIGQEWQGVRVSAITDAKRVLKDACCDIAAIAVPAPAAAEVADTLLGCGIHAILNFAPTRLRLQRKNGENVVVRNIDLAGELSVLTHRLATVALAQIEEA
ncbi:MAG: redox-sensing transcriptional repressor Rex [Candidatus Tyrphobacter sp.]